MRLTLAAVAVALATAMAFLAGRLIPPPAQPSPQPLAVGRFAPSSAGASRDWPVASPNAAIGQSLEALAAGLPRSAAPAAVASAGGDPVPPAASAPPPPPPAPPDIAAIFRRELSAIFRGPEGLSVLVVETSGDGRQARLLHVGDTFQGPWRLAGLTQDAAILQDGAEMRRVPLYAQAPSPAG